MATILRRTVLMEADNRPVLEGKTHLRPCDWAISDTSLGTMAEPFTPFIRNVPGVDIQNYDATEELCMVNNIELVDLDKIPTIFGGCHGGNLMPRAGR